MKRPPDGIERGIDLHDVTWAGERLGERPRRFDGSTDDRFDNLGELRRMCGRQEHARLTGLELALESEVRDRTMRIQQVAAVAVNLPDRIPDLGVGVPAARDVA